MEHMLSRSVSVTSQLSLSSISASVGLRQKAIKRARIVELLTLLPCHICGTALISLAAQVSTSYCKNTPNSTMSGAISTRDSSSSNRQ